MTDIFRNMFESARRKMRYVGDEAKDARLAICKSCEHYTSYGQCMQCGCYMPMKARFAGSECPIQKWGVKEDA